MEKTVNATLDSQSPSIRNAVFTLEFFLLFGLTLPLLLSIVQPTDSALFGPYWSTILWCTWVGTGAILPWRYARGGDHPLWAALIAAFASLLLLGALCIGAYELIQYLMP